MKYTFLIFLLLTEKVINGQERQSLYTELGKNGIMIHAGYDRQFSGKRTGIRVGAGTNFDRYLKAYAITAGIYTLAGKRLHFFEAGMDIQYIDIDKISDDQRGFGFIYPDYTVAAIYPSLNAGYRFMSRKFLFRTGFAPGVIKNDFIPGVYVSFGYSW